MVKSYSPCLVEYNIVLKCKPKSLITDRLDHLLDGSLQISQTSEVTLGQKLLKRRIERDLVFDWFGVTCRANSLADFEADYNYKDTHIDRWTLIHRVSCCLIDKLLSHAVTLPQNVKPSRKALQTLLNRKVQLCLHADLLGNDLEEHKRFEFSQTKNMLEIVFHSNDVVLNETPSMDTGAAVPCLSTNAELRLQQCHPSENSPTEVEPESSRGCTPMMEPVKSNWNYKKVLGRIKLSLKLKKKSNGAADKEFFV